MRPIQTLEEAHNYLIYIADALYALSKKYSVDKMDRVVLEKYAEGIIDYSKGLEQLKVSMEMKEQKKKKEIEEEKQQQTSKRKK
jgi:hypothetical protein